MDLLSASSIFRAVADPVRLRVLHLLHAEELSVGELVRVLRLPQSSVSRHLKALKDEGLVIDRAAGPATYYRALLGAENANGHGPLRQALREMLPAELLPSTDRHNLNQVLALRASSNDRFFDSVGLQWDALRESCFGASFHLEAFLTLLPSEWTVADLGTGTGYLLPYLSRHFHNVVAVDSSPAMLTLARNRLSAEAGQQSNVQFHEGRLEQLPLSPGSVDLTITILMLHHLEHLTDAINELARVTRPGGQVLIVDFERHDNSAFQARMVDERPGIDSAELQSALEPVGFGDVRRQVIGQPHQPDHELAPLPPLYCLTARRLPAVAAPNFKAAARRPKPLAPNNTGRKKP